MEGWKSSVPIAIILYSLCSGTLLLLNKLVVFYIPFPALMTLIQLVSTCLVVYFLKYSHLSQVDDLVSEKAIPYAYYVVAFTFGVYSNMKALGVSNVETVIVFRALTPLAVSFADYLFLGRELPSRQSFSALVAVVIGALIYVGNDAQFLVMGLSAYTWVTLYFFAIVLEMTYGKKIVQDVELNLSGSVLYTNLLAIPPFSLLFLFTEEWSNLQKFPTSDWPTVGIIVLSLSCLVGTGIGYSGWHCRHIVSATTYTIVGVMNKMLTVLINILIWDKHATPLGILGLVICLLGGSMYRQAPLRAEKEKSPDGQVV